jgi:hypothetical protein
VTSERGGLLLLLPPPLECFQPYPSLPVLAGYLRERGFRVHQADLNLGFYLWLLREDRLLRAYDKASARLRSLRAPDHVVTELALRIVGAPSVAEHCDEAIRLIRDDTAFYRLDTYRWALATLEQACRAWSAQWEGIHVGLGGLWLSAGPNLEHLRDAATDAALNPFYEYLETEVNSRLGEVKPSVVGVSVVQEDQLLAALAIAALVKRMDPEVVVVLGGPLITSMAVWWSGPRQLSPLVDLLVVGPGEPALEGILAGKPVRAIPNLVQPAGWSRRMWQGSVSTGPAPDYEGLPLERYFSPEVVYSLVATRGCYWNRCSFCNLTAHGPVYEYRGSSRLAADISLLARKHGATFFDLVGEVVPLRSLIGLGREIQDRGLAPRWHTQSRLDRPLGRAGARTLRAGGCRRLKFGLESACPRVLRLMHKGIDRSTVPQILKACHREDIALTVYCMVGFPGETAAEARETAEFLLADEELVRSRGFSTSFSPFVLERNARVAATPDRYGVEIVGPKGDASVSLLHRTHQGMNSAEVTTVRNDIARAFTRRCGGEAWPFTSNHSLLYLERGERGGSRVDTPREGRHALSDILEGRPRLRPGVRTISMGAWGVAYDPATATPRRYGSQTWQMMRLCDGQQSGRALCEALQGMGSTSGEALMALAELVASGIVEL